MVVTKLRKVRILSWIWIRKLYSKTGEKNLELEVFSKPFCWDCVKFINYVVFRRISFGKVVGNRRESENSYVFFLVRFW